MNPDLAPLPTCKERWEEMEMLPDGRRLCARCNHPVADFRRMTTEEITLVLAMSEERVCGFYAPEHLRPIAADSPRRRSGLVTLALGASLLASRGNAQTPAAPAHEQAQLPAPAPRDPPSSADASYAFHLIRSFLD